MNVRLETSPLETYRQHLARGVLAYQYSPDAERAVFFPRLVCPFTGSAHLEWRESGGKGAVYSATKVHRRDREPHVVALVDMTEGFRVMTQIVDATDDAIVGQPVSLVIAPGPDGEPAPFFRLDRQNG